MPIELHIIKEPTDAQLNDLIAIYSDSDTPIDDPAAWIANRLNHGHSLFAGYFNGKYIAAIWGIHTVNTWTLEDLCVREFTRRRGVAQQLLTRVVQQADSDRIDIQIPRIKIPNFMNNTLKSLGFSSIASACAGMIWTRDYQRPTTTP